MKQYRLSKRAENDLLNIFIYGIERFGLIQAEKYNSELDNYFGILILTIIHKNSIQKLGI